MGHRDVVRHQQMTGRIARAMPDEPRFPGLPQPGARVRLEGTTDIYTDLRPGAEGTVRFIDAMGTMFVDWDSGSGLGLVYSEDRWTVIG